MTIVLMLFAYFTVAAGLFMVEAPRTQAVSVSRVQPTRRVLQNAA